MLTALVVCVAGIAAGETAVSPQQLQEWVSEVFAGNPVAETPDRIRLEVRRQDHSVLNFGQSTIETPITIGTRHFEHGLGTHANSEIVAHVPQGAKTFVARVGVDNNSDTQGSHGTVIFIVEADGRELFRSAVLRGGEEPVEVSVALPADTASLTLKVDATPDGPSHDQADWADAQFVLADGTARYLDANQAGTLLHGTQAPFSFVYGGKDSTTLLPGWQRSVDTQDTPNATRYRIAWTESPAGLTVEADVKVYKRYPVVDWVLSLENKGGQDSSVIEKVQALDTMLGTGYLRHTATLHQLEGDACGEKTFQPKDTTVEPGKNLTIAPTGGRSSSISAFPFFNFEYGNQGIMAAIGWTGQWAAQFDRGDTGPTRIRAGMELTHFVLHPGERVRTPRIVLMPWGGDRRRAHNDWRQFMLTEVAPKGADGQPTALPIALQPFDRYNARPGWPTEAGQIDAVEMAHRIGCDTYWFDAAWFPGNFPDGVGNWFCKPEGFPKGLKPVSDVCHKYDMKFILWFEPERVAKNTQIANEHPEFVFGGKDGGLFKLNEPEARQWLTALLSQRIDEYGLDVYRNDFNMDPLKYWRQNDSEDRQGITEIRYVEGLYAMWDEMLAKHPGLLIDNCSSGGRRIDIEMCSRSVPLWRSDTNCSPRHPEWNQAQTMALCQYVPLNTATPWFPEPYEVRSAATAGLLCEFGYLEPDFPEEEAKRLIAEVRENQRYWHGDFYPLTPIGIQQDQFAAFQLHRADLDAGIVMAYRRADCGFLGLILGLQGIDPAGQYAVQFIDDAGKVTEQTMRGAQMREDFPLRLSKPQQSLLVRYQRVKGN